MRPSDLDGGGGLSDVSELSLVEGIGVKEVLVLILLLLLLLYLI